MIRLSNQHSTKRPIPVSVLREETFSKYPYWATRELLMNAIMHRDYEPTLLSILRI